MIIFPNCKINLGLNILRKRSDGYHDLETIFYPLPIKDALEVLNAVEISPEFSEKNQANPNNVQFTTTGLVINGEEKDNLCIKAYELLKKDFPQLPPIRLHLHKTIPMGAGLGGGSSDAAFTLKLLNDKYNLGISHQQLINYALRLGSDCPFFLLNNPCFATGRGEIMQEIALDLSQYSFLLVNPAIHINTKWAFSNIIPEDLKSDTKKLHLRDAIQQPISSWKNELTNDFEKPVFDLYPEIKTIRDRLYDAGALYAAMSGSGSTVFGIFETPINLNFPDEYTVLKVIAN